MTEIQLTLNSSYFPIPPFRDQCPLGNKCEFFFLTQGRKTRHTTIQAKSCKLKWESKR